MPLLVRNLHQRHLQQSCHRLSQAYPGQKAGHIRPLHRPGPGADSHGGHRPRVHMGKQPTGQGRQAFDMGKQGVCLAQTQGSRLHR